MEDSENVGAGPVPARMPVTAFITDNYSMASSREFALAGNRAGNYSAASLLEFALAGNRAGTGPAPT